MCTKNNYRKHRYSDGSTGFIFKNFDSTSPTVIRSYYSKTKVDLKIMEKIAAGLGAEYQSPVAGLLYNINETNESLMLAFGILYTSFLTNPERYRDYLVSETRNIIRHTQKLSEFRMQTTFLINMAKEYPNKEEIIFEINNLYREYLSTIKNNIDAIETSIEIKKQKESMEELAGGKNGS